MSNECEILDTIQNLKFLRIALHPMNDTTEELLVYLVRMPADVVPVQGVTTVKKQGQRGSLPFINQLLRKYKFILI